MGIPDHLHRLTEGEYLSLERAARLKSEFYEGEMFSMAGGSRQHSRIAINLIRELSLRLRGRRCEPYNSDLRVKVEATGLLTDPGLSVAWCSQRFLDATEHTLVHPT